MECIYACAIASVEARRERDKLRARVLELEAALAKEHSRADTNWARCQLLERRLEEHLCEGEELP